MAKIAIVTGATGGLGQEFIKEIQKIDEIDEIWAVGRNEKKLEELRKKYSIIRPVIADFSTDGVEVIKQKILKDFLILFENIIRNYRGALWIILLKTLSENRRSPLSVLLTKKDFQT